MTTETKYRELGPDECPDREFGDQADYGYGLWVLTAMHGTDTVATINQVYGRDWKYRRPVKAVENVTAPASRAG